MVVGDIVNVYKLYVSNIEERKQKVLKRISTMDVVLSLMVVFLAFGMIYDGTNQKYYVEKSIGMLIAATFIMGWYMISNQRTAAYNRGLLDRLGSTANSTDVLDITNMDLINFLGDVLNLLMRNYSSAIGLWTFLIVLLFLPLYFNSKSKDTKVKPIPESVSWFVLWYGFVFTIYIIYLIDKSAKSFNV